MWLGQREHLSPSLTHLRWSLSRICNVAAYGDGDEFIPEFDALKIVKKEQPDAIFIGSNQYKFTNLDKVQIPKALKLGDPHANHERHCKWCKENKVYPLSVFGDWIPKYEECFGKGNVGWMPYSVDHQSYPNMGLRRRIDIFYVTSPSSTAHPIRYAMSKELPRHGQIKSFTNKSYLSEELWIHTLNESKIFAFDCSMYSYAVPKIYEGLACGAAVMCTRPADADRLHLINNENYIEVTPDNWLERLKYYLIYNDKRRKLAKRGYQTFLKYLSSDVRAFELTETLGRLTYENIDYFV